MKALKLLPLVLLFLVASCSSVRVTSDYDTNTNFTEYKTFAFYKKGIDKAEISDLDKRRILKAVEAEMLAKGFTKSENPDLLVNIFTKSRQKVDVYNDHYYYGWRPWYYGPNFGTHISKYTEGTLFVDLIDASKKEMVWQGIGSGALTRTSNVAKKEERIKEFVNEIMQAYPPNTVK
ncbi:MAG TPA: DUF4136 domain-containing protein [Flavobacteriaceae bacterium]|nr:DUF4136 domain-containing protein [Flavobacteriaceae bacterium]